MILVGGPRKCIFYTRLTQMPVHIVILGCYLHTHVVYKIAMI